MATLNIAIVEAPSVLGLRPSGVQHLPDALLRAGLANRLGARHAATVDAPRWNAGPDRDTGMLNPAAIAAYTTRLADAVGAVLDAGDTPVVLGGDCSILLGNLLALRRRGRHGLLFLDGHADFYDAETNVNGEAASSELACATGRGPALLTQYEGYERLIGDDDVCVIGHRDAAEASRYGSAPLPSAMRTYDLQAVRRIGARAAARSAVEHLDRPALDGFWLHLDADVLDDAVMPAVDYRQPDGLSWGELRDVLAVARSSGRVVGVDVTIYNPLLDPDGAIARSFVDVLAHSLS